MKKKSFAVMLTAATLALGIVSNWTLPSACIAIVSSVWLLYLVAEKIVKGGE